MSPYANRLLIGALLFASAGAGIIRIEPTAIAHAHESFAAGRPGDPNKPARAIKVVMREDGKKMAFEPARITVRKGEQIRSFWKTTAPTITSSFLRPRPRTASTPS